MALCDPEKGNGDEKSKDASILATQEESIS